DQVVLHDLDAADSQNVVRDQRANYQRVAFADAVAGVNAQVLAVRHQVLAFVADGLARVVDGLNPDGALAALFLAQADHAGDLRHDGGVARPAGFEDFGDARETAGDVLCTAHFPRRLSQERAGRHFLAVADFQVRLFGHEVRHEDLAAIVLDSDLRVQV